jgi:16S rRNA (guanine966-N2)-methyltransferase
MRVISGKFKGLKLFSPKNDIRPTLDRVKESVFDVIQFKVGGANVLDLFAGSGAYGIEAVSRGCKSAVFNDINPSSVELIIKNCTKAGFKPVVTTLGYKDALTGYINKGQSFDIIFLDPPFKSKYGNDAIEIITGNNLLNIGGVIVYEHEGDNNIDLPSGYEIKSKKYGSVYIDFIINKGEQPL